MRCDTIKIGTNFEISLLIGVQQSMRDVEEFNDCYLRRSDDIQVM